MPKRKEISHKIRKAVFEIYGGACANCGLADIRHLDVDHVISVKDGGSNDLENFQCLCKHCNSGIKQGATIVKLPPIAAKYQWGVPPVWAHQNRMALAKNIRKSKS